MKRAPATFVMDLGIDLNLGEEWAPYYPLQQGLVQVEQSVGGGRGTPAWYEHFVQGDRISFRLWQINPLEDKGFQPVSFEARFVDPMSPTVLQGPFARSAQNPITADSSSIVEVAAQQPQGVETSVFGDTASGAFLIGRKMPLGRQYRLARRGNYLMSIYVGVRVIDVLTDHTTLRTYRLDPEVIVGEAENPECPPPVR